MAKWATTWKKNVIVPRFKRSAFKVGGLLQIWTVDAFAVKGESMRMERFEDFEAWQPAGEPTCKIHSLAKKDKSAKER